MKPIESLSDLVREIKKSTNAYIRNNNFTSQSFNWQSGYGAFSCSRIHIDRVCKYILNQKEHHRKEYFQHEYLRFIKEHEIEIGRKQLFEFFEENDG